MRRWRWFVPVMAMLSIGAAGAPPLVQAIKDGNANEVRALLNQRTDVNAAEVDGTTALHWAAHFDNLTAADLLIKAGASVQAANRYGLTPLWLACINGSGPMVERLLAAGADPNTRLREGDTALMTAARSGNVAAVKALILRGADVNASESWKGQTALMWAAAANNAAVVDALIEAGASVNARTKYKAAALFTTGGFGRRAERNSDATKQAGFTALHFAVRAGSVDAVKALLKRGATLRDTTGDGTGVLVLAIASTHFELADWLLEQGADPNAAEQGWTALHQIAWSRRHNAGFNLPGPVPTGGLDSLDLVRKLVQKGANVNARMTREPTDGNRNQLNRIGSTPFLMAAKSDDVPLMKVLLEQGADASLTTNRGTTALMVAAGVGIWAPGENPGTHDEALAAAKLALEAGGGTVNDIDQDGETALHGAVYRGGAIPVIQFLIDKGAVLDVKNKKGWTPVVVADGVEYTPAVLKRYPEAAALLRKAMRERGLPVPPPNHSAEKTAEAQDTAGGKTIWDGVFTEEQAGRGQKIYTVSCAPCHKADLLGDTGAPALAGPEFFSRWNGSSADDLVKTIRASMPQDAPDSLSPRAYADIVSYLLKANGSPAGSTELPVERDALKQILIARPK